MLPNLIIAGVSKGGTTSLFNYLAQHPDVCSSERKELRYFIPLRYGQTLPPREEYAAHFAHCGQQRFAVEATPGYFYGGAALARGIKATCPDPHVVISLRSPADRCWSWFRFVRSRARIPKDMTFDAYLDRCEELHRAGVDGAIEHQPFWGLGGGCYDTYLDDWIDELGDRLRVLFFDDVVTDPHKTVRGLCEWLDIDSTVVDDFDYGVENKTEQYRSRRIQRTAVEINKRSETFFHHHRSAKRVLRRVYYTFNRSQPELRISPSARQRMAEFYRPHNIRLAHQLSAIGITLPATWSEDG
ncbi:MAG: sulfotransferase [Actinomycetota bacterium]|nr:sulfotransferase [Actinomycetota bacterium]